jgi:hypothetical protein
MPYWTFNAFGFIEQKVEDKRQYDKLVSLRGSFKWQR